MKTTECIMCGMTGGEDHSLTANLLARVSDNTLAAAIFYYERIGSRLETDITSIADNSCAHAFDNMRLPI